MANRRIRGLTPPGSPVTLYLLATSAGSCCRSVSITFNHARPQSSGPDGEQRVDKCGRIKQLQVIDLLADTDILHRQRHLLADGNHDTTPSGPIQFGQDDDVTVVSLTRLKAVAVEATEAEAVRATIVKPGETSAAATG